jgi:hypothetical protein
MEHLPSLTTRVRIPEGVISHEVQDELFILHPQANDCFVLDSIGARIWHLIETHQPLKKVLDSLMQEYEVTEAECGQDILSFVAQMLEKGVLEISKDEETK